MKSIGMHLDAKLVDIHLLLVYLANIEMNYIEFLGDVRESKGVGA